MKAIYLVLFLAVILQLNAKENDINNLVDNSIDRNYLLPHNDFRPFAYNFRNLYKSLSAQEERVKIQLYYECLCPDCRDFDNSQFKMTVLMLGPYLDIKLYPYGNAHTTINNGHIEFTCQHGPTECYGNKLHACAIDYLNNVTAAVFFNACLMDRSQANYGSDDVAVDVCSQSMGVDSTPIKQCAKSNKGDQLLQYYGVESKKANFRFVPYILINGVEYNGNTFMQDVCKVFKNPPPACQGRLL